MANLGDYDEPLPPPKAYGRRLTAEEHEAVVSAETEKQLNLLLTHLEQNPRTFSELLKKRKIKEMEEAGFLSNLKVKVLSVLYGEDFIDDIDPQTCQDKLKEFESQSIKVYNYSQEAKGNSRKFTRRYSKRIAERQLAKQQGECKIPTPPPPPPIMRGQLRECCADLKLQVNTVTCKEKSQPSDLSMDKKEGPSSVYSLQDEIKSLSKKIVKRQPLRMISIDPTSERKTKSAQNLGSFHSEIMAAKENLRPVGLPDQTPYQLSKLRREKETKEQDESHFPLFNQELIKKFKNARSPQSPRYSDCESPWRYETIP